MSDSPITNEQGPDDNKDLKKLNRDELDTLAAQKGLVGADKLDTKADVIKAIEAGEMPELAADDDDTNEQGPDPIEVYEAQAPVIRHPDGSTAVPARTVTVTRNVQTGEKSVEDPQRDEYEDSLNLD